MGKAKPRSRAVEATEYEPDDHEKAIIKKLRDRQDNQPPAPRLTVTYQTGSDVPQIGLDHPDKPVGYILLMEALGTTDIAFVEGYLSQLVTKIPTIYPTIQAAYRTGPGVK